MYTAGWNTPGYLPSMDVAEFDTFDEARDFIIDELEDVADGVDLDETAEDIEDVIDSIRDLPDGKDFAIMSPNGFAYWVTED